MEEQDIESFNRRSRAYERSISQKLIFDRIHWAALKAVPLECKPETILDIGCGTGRLLRKAAVHWPEAHLVGVDPAEGMVAEARHLTPGAVIILGMAETLPWPDLSVDLAMSTMSFHHWRDQVQGLAQVARVLRPGGYFILVDVATPFGLARIFPHGRQPDPERVRAMFAQAGLEVAMQKRFMGHFIMATLGKRG
jgi:ubiquinone/menaquinone biosynthesis C-methylase UbiE